MVVISPFSQASDRQVQEEPGRWQGGGHWCFHHQRHLLQVCQARLWPITFSILSVVALSELEPYGVRGGSLVVLFAPAPNSKDTPVKVLFWDHCLFHILSSSRSATSPWIHPLWPPLSYTSQFRFSSTHNTSLKVKVFYHLQYIFRMKILAQASMAVTTRVRQTLTNIVRKIGGKPTQVWKFTFCFTASVSWSLKVHIDPKFKIIKKKLYRSSTSN